MILPPLNCTPALPDDVLIVEDDPIIALDFEDTVLGFGVKTVRTAASVARALEMIADRAPDFALLDVGLPAAFANWPRLPKPFSSDALQALLKGRPDNSAKC